jgi:hypothetical protein
MKFKQLLIIQLGDIANRPCTIGGRKTLDIAIYSGAPPRTHSQAQSTPTDHDSAEAERQADDAQHNDQQRAHGRRRQQRRKVERMQRAVEPAISAPRGIELLDRDAAGRVNMIRDPLWEPPVTRSHPLGETVKKIRQKVLSEER